MKPVKFKKASLKANNATGVESCAAFVRPDWARHKPPGVVQASSDSLGSAAHGFTLIEVLVALSITAVALIAGLQATAALTNNAARQSNVLLAHLCAENELIKIRLSRQMPGVGNTAVACEQGGRDFQVMLSVRPTPNPEFRRVDAQVKEGSAPILQLTTIVTRY